MQLEEMEESIYSLSARKPARHLRGKGGWDRGDESPPPRDRRASSRDWQGGGHSRSGEYSHPRERPGKEHGGSGDFPHTGERRGTQPRQPSWGPPEWTTATRREVPDLNTLSAPIIERIAGLVDAYSSSRDGGRKAGVWGWSDPSHSAGASPPHARRREYPEAGASPRHVRGRSKSPHGCGSMPMHDSRGVWWQQEGPERARSRASSSSSSQQGEDEEEWAWSRHFQSFTPSAMRTDELSSSYFAGESASSSRASAGTKAGARAGPTAASPPSDTHAAQHLHLFAGGRASPAASKHGTADSPAAHSVQAPPPHLDASTQMDEPDIVAHSTDAASSPMQGPPENSRSIVSGGGRNRSVSEEGDFGGAAEAETREEFLVRYCSDLEERVRR